MIFWPAEECYSEVIESKIVEPKDPAVGQTVKVKEGGKVFSGRVEAVGSKTEIEHRLSEMENTALVDDGHDKSAESATNTEQGELSYLFILSTLDNYTHVHIASTKQRPCTMFTIFCTVETTVNKEAKPDGNKKGRSMCNTKQGRL